MLYVFSKLWYLALLLFDGGHGILFLFQSCYIDLGLSTFKWRGDGATQGNR